MKQYSVVQGMPSRVYMAQRNVDQNLGIYAWSHRVQEASEKHNLKGTGRQRSRMNRTASGVDSSNRLLNRSPAGRSEQGTVLDVFFDIEEVYLHQHEILRVPPRGAVTISFAALGHSPLRSE